MKVIIFLLVVILGWSILIDIGSAFWMIWDWGNELPMKVFLTSGVVTFLSGFMLGVLKP